MLTLTLTWTSILSVYCLISKGKSPPPWVSGPALGAGYREQVTSSRVLSKLPLLVKDAPHSYSRCSLPYLFSTTWNMLPFPPVASSVDSAFLFSGFTLGLFIPFQVIPPAQLDLGPSSMLPGPDLVLRVIPKSSIIILGFPLCSHPFSPWAPRTPTTLKHILNGLPL